MTHLTSLQPQLNQQRDEMQAMFPEEAKALLGAASHKLAASDLVANARQVGDTAPDFTLPGVDGANVTLSSLLAQGPAVLVFYRGPWCPFCNLQLRALQQAESRIKALGGTLVGVSPSTPDASMTMAEKRNLSFTVLSDMGNAVSRSYGLVYQLDPTLWDLYKGFGIDIPATNGDATHELPIAATYVVNRDGVIAEAFLTTDYTQRMEPALIIHALENLAKARCSCDE